MKFIADILSNIGNFAASFGTQGCWALFFDEPKMPKKLIER